MTTRYNHAYIIAFEVISNNYDGSDVTPAMFRAELQRRMDLLDSEGDLAWYEACDRDNSFDFDPEHDGPRGLG